MRHQMRIVGWHLDTYRLAMGTERLQLMHWVPEFTDDFAAMVSHPAVVEFISAGRPLTLDEASAISGRSSSLWDEYGIGPWAAIEKKTGE